MSDHYKVNVSIGCVYFEWKTFGAISIKENSIRVLWNPSFCSPELLS